MFPINGQGTQEHTGRLKKKSGKRNMQINQIRYRPVVHLTWEVIRGRLDSRKQPEGDRARQVGRGSLGDEHEGGHGV